MKLAAIVAMSTNRVIGCQNRLPWHLPADLRHFKALTLHHTVLMGRKTFDSIGKPLPQRENIIITRDKTFSAPSPCIITHTIEEAIEKAKEIGKETFVIGGMQLYQQLLPFIHRIYLTEVHHTFTGDTYFPALNATEWKEVERVNHDADLLNPYSYSFLTLEHVSCLNYPK